MAGTSNDYFASVLNLVPSDQRQQFSSYISQSLDKDSANAAERSADVSTKRESGPVAIVCWWPGDLESELAAKNVKQVLTSLYRYKVIQLELENPMSRRIQKAIGSAAQACRSRNSSQLVFYYCGSSTSIDDITGPHSTTLLGPESLKLQLNIITNFLFSVFSSSDILYILEFNHGNTPTQQELHIELGSDASGGVEMLTFSTEILAKKYDFLKPTTVFLQYLMDNAPSAVTCEEFYGSIKGSDLASATSYRRSSNLEKSLAFSDSPRAVQSATNASLNNQNPMDLELQQLIKTLNESIIDSQVFPTGSQHYDAVRVLMVNWDYEDPSFGLQPEIDELSKTFKQEFDFDVDHFKIDSKDSFRSMMKGMNNFLNASSGLVDRELLIFFYSGHGADTRGSSNLVGFARPGSSTAPELPFTAFQQMLQHDKSDVVLILNCCFGGNAALSSTTSTNELLAASSADMFAYSGKTSFPKALDAKLKALAPKPFTVAMLHRELASDFAATAAQPFHTFLGGGDQESIQLCKLNRGGSSSRVTAQQAAGSSVRVWAEIKIPQSESLNVETWSHWITNKAPNNVISLDFHP